MVTKRVRSCGMETATQFVHVLRQAVEQPQYYAGEPRNATGMDKLLHVGWSEHAMLERAFRSAVTVESRVQLHRFPGGKEQYLVEVLFIAQDGKRTSIGTSFGKEGRQFGGITMSL